MLALTQLLDTVILLLIVMQSCMSDTVSDFFNSPVPITKTVISNARLVFVAGLEGTGHHAWNAVFQECVDAQRCEVAESLTKTLMEYDPSRGIVHGLFAPEDVLFHSRQLEDTRKIMKAMVDRGGSKVYLIGLGFVRHSAMMSYPNYNGANKAMDHPDIALLSHLAELVGLDFRVIVLQRSAKEILASTRRRGIGGYLEPNILIDNAAVLYTQMQLIDPAYYHCVDYRQLGNMTVLQKDELGEFIHPTQIPKVLPDMLSTVQYHDLSATASSKTPVPKTKKQKEVEAKDVLVRSAYDDVTLERSDAFQEWQLAQRLALIDDLCRRRSSTACV